MPCKTVEAQRAFQREWVRGRRAAFLQGKRCAVCGAGERLELHHVDPAAKIDHKVWSWCGERREAELAKCQVLCQDCHRQLHIDVIRRMPDVGVRQKGSRWRAEMRVDGKKLHLGTFATREEARAAYLAKAEAIRAGWASSRCQQQTS